MTTHFESAPPAPPSTAARAPSAAPPAPSRPRGAALRMASLLGAGLLVATAWVGCAKVSSRQEPGPGGGTGGSSQPAQPAIPGLTEIRVTPPEQPLALMVNGMLFTGTATFRAEGTVNGASMDITDRVNWSASAPTAMVNRGVVNVSGPGVFTITARSGTLSGSGKLLASASGSRIADGFPAADAPKLDAEPGGSPTSLAYPLDNSIFPANFGPITVHITKTSGQDIARLTFIGDGLDLKYYARCETTWRNSSGSCYVTLPLSFTTLLIAPSNERDIKMTARLASASGGGVTQSNTVNLAWANVRLSGGLYYWTTIDPVVVPGYTLPPMATKGTAVMRYDFDAENPDGAKPQVIYTDQGMPNVGGTNLFGNPGPAAAPITVPPNNPASPPAQAGSNPLSGENWGEGTCVGCHALSFDGKLLAFSIGGSTTGSFAILDLEARRLLELEPTAGPADQANINYLRRFRKPNFAAFTTFGPSDVDRRMVNSYRGRLALHRADTSLAVLDPDLFAAATTEQKTDPFWSPDGMHFAFTSYMLNGETQSSKYNGDTKTTGQVWVASATPMGPNNDARLLIPREPGVTSYYPTISHDGELLAFNKSSCSGPNNPGGYGTAPCDGYDDITATLWLTSPAGRAPAKLVRANRTDNGGNSWPRWSPDKGNFRGQSLYWLAFSSRSSYGMQVNGEGPTAAVPQLWFAAVVVGGEFSGGDVSFSPVWLPNQNLLPTVPTGNHVPQWVKFAVVID